MSTPVIRQTVGFPVILRNAMNARRGKKPLATFAVESLMEKFCPKVAATQAKKKSPAK